ncbi:type II secretion system GspH family protein [Patescibacteria group bacterium]|nr:type II secretion system GspH family protein [Patescibacteria group bacterium]MBU2633178.1 type II secretion system GspH family protein [Patescibacteria group bacterium]
MIKNRGFTIIEMLIVLAIIAMLSSIAMSLFSSSKAKARDSRREEDMKDIQNGLNLYVSNSQIYPICDEEVINGASDCLSQVMISTGFMKGVPYDPLGRGTGGSCGGSNPEYCYVSPDGFSYMLRYFLETDNISGKDSGWQEVIVNY